MLGPAIYVQNLPMDTVTSGLASTIFKFRAIFLRGGRVFTFFFDRLRDPVDCGSKRTQKNLGRTPLLHSLFRTKKQNPPAVPEDLVSTGGDAVFEYR